MTMSVPVKAIAPRLPRLEPSLRVHLKDLAIVSALVLLGAAVRWPDYRYVPALTDELLEVYRAALIAQGRLHTFTNVSSHIGSLFNYLLAGLFVVFGPHLYLPRLAVLVIGCLTVLATYLLAREWGGRLAGVLGATLVAANPVHVLLNSHISWSNSIAPLFTTLGVWQLSRAVRQRSGPTLAWCGLLLGLALQTHLSTVLLLPGCALYLLWQAPGLLRTRWVWIASGLFGVGYSPIILYNLLSRFETLQAFQEARSWHAGGRAFGPDSYLGNLGSYSLLILHTATATLDAPASLVGYRAEPVSLFGVALCIMAPVALARRGTSLPLLLLFSAPAIGAFFGLSTYQPMTDEYHGRYVMPTVVVVTAAVGAFLGSLASSAGRMANLRVGLVAVALLILVGNGLVTLSDFSDDRAAESRSTIEALGAIEAAREPAEVVFLDLHLDERRLGNTAIQLDRALEMLLTIRQIPYQDTDVEPGDIRARLAGQSSVLVVLDRSSIRRLRERFSLTELAVITSSASRADQLRAPLSSRRGSSVTALWRRLTLQRGPEPRPTTPCAECDGPTVFRISSHD